MTIHHDLDVVLKAPLRLGPTDQIRGGQIRIAPEFRYTVKPDAHDWGAIVARGPGARLIENVEFVGWHELPADIHDPFRYSVSGLQIEHAQGVVVSGCSFTAFPRYGIYGLGLVGFTFRQLRFDLCGVGIHLNYQANGPHSDQGLVEDVLITDDRGWDTDGDPFADTDGKVDWHAYPSLHRPGSWAGGDGIAAYCTNTTFRRVIVLGEHFAAMKLSTSNAVIEDCRMPGLALQGLFYPDSSVLGGPTQQGRIEVLRTIFDPDLGSRGRFQTQDGNTLQFSWGNELTPPVELEDCTLFAPRPGTLYGPPAGVVRPGFRFASIQTAASAGGIGMRAHFSRCRFYDRHVGHEAPRWMDANPPGSITHDSTTTFDRLDIRSGIKG